MQHQGGLVFDQIFDSFLLEKIAVKKITTHTATSKSSLYSILDFLRYIFRYFIIMLNVSYSVFKIYPLLLSSIMLICITNMFFKHAFSSSEYTVLNVHKIQSVNSSFLPLEERNKSLKYNRKKSNIHR